MLVYSLYYYFTQKNIDTDKINTKTRCLKKKKTDNNFFYQVQRDLVLLSY